MKKKKKETELNRLANLISKHIYIYPPKQLAKDLAKMLMEEGYKRSEGEQ